jgi:enoyl-CoA hydratase
VSSDSAEVLIRVECGIGRITLNRPKALNALTTGMLWVMQDALTAWEDDLQVRLVLIDGAGDRGLCAGGDIRMIWESAKAGGAAAREFFRIEYAVNAHIAAYRKPYVALMDGVVMGGGVGVSSHGSVRIVTERAVVGMPEVTIGFVPDVGGSYLLSRAPGQAGTHIGLTGCSLSPADAIWAGLADHYLPSDAVTDLVSALRDMGEPADAVAALCVRPPASELQGHCDWIDACYRFDTVAEIVAALHDSAKPAAVLAAGTIAGRSPTAVSVTLESVRRAARTPTLQETLETEFQVSCACLESHDLVEGIRAQVIDKDRLPRWSPDDIAQVRRADVAAFFEDQGHGRLGLPAQSQGANW